MMQNSYHENDDKLAVGWIQKFYLKPNKCHQSNDFITGEICFNSCNNGWRIIFHYNFINYLYNKYY